MEPFNTPLKIREISLPHRAVFGPMAGFTDAPARRLMAQHGAGFTVSEMVSSRALVYGDHKTVSLLKAEPNGAPYGVQIFGEVPEIMGQAAAAVEQYAFDFLDINMGCPAPKIVSGGAGSKLMLDPDRCGRIVEEVVKNTSLKEPGVAQSGPGDHHAVAAGLLHHPHSILGGADIAVSQHGNVDGILHRRNGRGGQQADA